MLLKTMGKLGTLSVRICTQSTAWHIPLHMQPLPRPVVSILCSSPAVRVRSAVCLRISRERSAVSLSASQPAEMVRVPAMLKILAALQATSPALASTEQRACSVTGLRTALCATTSSAAQALLRLCALRCGTALVRFAAAADLSRYEPPLCAP